MNDDPHSLIPVCLAVIVVMAAVGGAVNGWSDKPAELRPKDPRPAVYPPSVKFKFSDTQVLPRGVTRMVIEEHVYYSWTSGMIHSEACTNSSHAR